MTAKEKIMASYDEETPESFLKEVMYECEGVTKAEKLTIRRMLLFTLMIWLSYKITALIPNLGNAYLGA